MELQMRYSYLCVCRYIVFPVVIRLHYIEYSDSADQNN